MGVSYEVFRWLTSEPWQDLFVKSTMRGPKEHKSKDGVPNLFKERVFAFGGPAPGLRRLT